MARVYLSFLGTNDYIPCAYYSSDGLGVPNVRFVQEATVQLFCKAWSQEDRILIFTTDEAYRKNWEDNGHTDSDGKTPEREGLKRRLGRLGLQPSIQNVAIPEGKTEQEIWRIFQVLFESFGSSDRAIFDITHSFRSIPMLAMVVLNYAKVMKGLSVESIYYGAFETLGSHQQASKMPLEHRRVPIFDLTAFDALLDWTLAIDRFLEAGDATRACQLAMNEVRPLLRDSRGADQAAAAIRSVAEELERFSKVMATCRGRKISDVAIQLKRKVAQCAGLESVPAPFKPLLGKIAERMEVFSGDSIPDGVRATRWCLEHNLIQQACTILREVVIGYFVERAGADPTNQDQREFASHAAQKLAQGKSTEEPLRNGKGDLQIKQRILQVLEADLELVKVYAKLAAARNDLNHAGFRDNASHYSSFAKKMDDWLTIVELIIPKGR